METFDLFVYWVWLISTCWWNVLINTLIQQILLMFLCWNILLVHQSGCSLKIEMSWDNGVFKPWAPPLASEKELQERTYTSSLPSDFTPFYITIGICTTFFLFLVLLNLCFCRSERFKSYWRDPHTGNR